MKAAGKNLKKCPKKGSKTPQERKSQDIRENVSHLLELDLLPEGVPAEEGGGVGDFPLLDEAVAVEVGRSPVALAHANH